MKQQVTLALSLTLAAGLLAGCADTTGGSQPTGAAHTSPADAIPSAAQSADFTAEMKIPPAEELSPEDGGATTRTPPTLPTPTTTTCSPATPSRS